MASPPRDPAAPMSPERVRREILAESLQHPLTLYPFGLAALATVYALAASPVFGATIPALAVALGGGLLSVGSFAWQYLVQGPGRAALKAQQQIAWHEREAVASRLRPMEQQRDELARALGDAPGDVGREARKALDQLAHAYDRLGALLAQRRGAREAAYVGLLAERADETCRQGLSLLDDVAETLRVVVETDRDALVAEVAELERELSAVGEGPGAAERAGIRRETLASHRERLAALDAQQLRIERLLAQVDACEAALERVRLSLPGLQTAIHEQVAQEAADRLTRTIEVARRQQRLLEDGYYQPVAGGIRRQGREQHG